MFCTKCGALLIDNKCPTCDYTIEQNVITDNSDIDNNINVQVKNIVDPIDNSSIIESQSSISTIIDMENSVETIESAPMLTSEFSQNSQQIANYDILADNSYQPLLTSVRDKKGGKKLFIIQIITAILLLICAIYTTISVAGNSTFQWDNAIIRDVASYELNTDEYKIYELNDKSLPKVEGKVKYIIAEYGVNNDQLNCVIFLLFKKFDKETQYSFYYITTTVKQRHRAVQQLNERYGAGQIPTITPSSEEVYHD